MGSSNPHPTFPLLFLSIIFLDSLSSAVNDDKSAMYDLAAAITPTPLGWSSELDYCSWPYVKCDHKMRVVFIDLAYQSLSGGLPPSLNSLSHLTTLSLHNNHLTGPLPSFANLSMLQKLYLESNNFTSIPAGGFAGLTSLQTLSLSDNINLSPWPFPIELADSTSLVTLDATNVNIYGPIPDIFGSFPKLKNLRLSKNNLTGSLPGSFNRSSIENLRLNNQIAGLSGPIGVLSGMTQLAQVWLHANHFNGPIPDLSDYSQIFDLRLRDNQLTGIVPPSLVSLPKLVNVSLTNNMLQGPFPDFPVNVSVDLGLTNNSFCKNTKGDCDPQVTTLLEVAGALGYPKKLSEVWTGNDACKGWDFVTCDTNRNVISVNMAKQGFSGTISSAFAKLTSLRHLYLNDNNLTGGIPEVLRFLPQLSELDVSYNHLSGKVPNFCSSVVVLTAGNQNLRPSSNGDGNSLSIPSSMSFSKTTRFWKTYNFLLVILIPVISVFVSLILIKVYRKRKQTITADAKQWGGMSLLAPDTPVRITYEALKFATNNFDEGRKLGAGGFGSVFEGSLTDGSRIAVKRLDHLSQGQKEFLAEVQTIGSIHHVNLVKLVGFCVENTHRLLVYEHMSNGSLDKWIFSKGSRPTLDWDTRKKIILHIAKGLAYLHEECERRIAHLDIKPQNVLLDDTFNAKLSDFGLAKLIDRDQSHIMTQVRGTRGYLAPEWLGRKITEKVDVYSYGVVVLEILFGRKNLDYSLPEESDILLINMVRKKAEANQLFELLDICSEDMQQNGEEVEKTIKLATWCLQIDPGRRPSMSMVVKILEEVTSMDLLMDFCSLLPAAADGGPMTNATTQVSACILSGPR